MFKYPLPRAGLVTHRSEGIPRATATDAAGGRRETTTTVVTSQQQRAVPAMTHFA